MQGTVSENIANTTVAYLENTLDDGFYASDYTHEQAVKLREHLILVFDKQSVDSHPLSIEKGFINYFSARSQEIRVTVSDSDIQLEKRLKEGEKDPHMDRAFYHLQHHITALCMHQDEFRIYDFLFQFPQERVQELKEILLDVKLEIDEVRTHIRHYVTEAFTLSPRDIILFLKQQMYIRHFVPPQKKTAADARFNGHNPDELHQIYEERLPEDFSAELLQLVNELEQTTLNFSQLSNELFHKKLPDACCLMSKSTLKKWSWHSTGMSYANTLTSC
jgi:hypothetical protein